MSNVLIILGLFLIIVAYFLTLWVEYGKRKKLAGTIVCLLYVIGFIMISIGIAGGNYE